MNRTRRVDRLTSCYENTRNFVSFELEDRFIVSYLFQRCIDIIKSVVHPLLPSSKFKWIINITRNVSVSIKNFVLDDSERLICISLSTRQFFLLFTV